MEIGETIRKYRKEAGFTQEEMANRLGVTAPAVNKWENGNSNPDIELLAPIARLLQISIDTLMSFHKELSEKEISIIIRELDGLFAKEGYEKTYERALEIVREYPSSNQLIWQVAVILDARRLVGDCENPEKYDAQINAWYERALCDEDIKVRKQAADSLFGFYLRKKDFDKAFNYLQYFSDYDPMKKFNQARCYKEKREFDTACKLLEELLFSGYNTMNMIFGQLVTIAIETGDISKARYFAEKISTIAGVLEMGTYHVYAPMLDVICAEKNVEETYRVTEQLLNNTDGLWDFKKSPLYEHMAFQEIESSFVSDLKNKILQNFKNPETFSYMKGNAEWEALISEDNKIQTFQNT